jgi:hypothetical protein
MASILPLDVSTNNLVRRPRAILTDLNTRFAETGNLGIGPRLRIWLQISLGGRGSDGHPAPQLGQEKHVDAHFTAGAAATSLVGARLIDATFSFTSHTSIDTPALLHCSPKY